MTSYSLESTRNKIYKIVELIGGRSKPASQLKSELMTLTPEEVHERFLEAIRTCARDEARAYRQKLRDLPGVGMTVSDDWREWTVFGR